MLRARVGDALRAGARASSFRGAAPEEDPHESPTGLLATSQGSVGSTVDPWSSRSRPSSAIGNSSAAS
eukprot:10557120-Lingulodinium_polyedra.AAC.1